MVSNISPQEVLFYCAESKRCQYGHSTDIANQIRKMERATCAALPISVEEGKSNKTDLKGFIQFSFLDEIVGLFEPPVPASYPLA